MSTHLVNKRNRLFNIKCRRNCGRIKSFYDWSSQLVTLWPRTQITLQLKNQIKTKKSKDYPIEGFEMISEVSVGDDNFSSNPLAICFTHLLWKLMLITLIRAISSCSQLLNGFSSTLGSASFENTVNYALSRTKNNVLLYVPYLNLS